MATRLKFHKLAASIRAKKGNSTNSDRLYEKPLDIPVPTPITPEQYKEPLADEKWLERVNYYFRDGIPNFHIPRSDIFYIKALIKDRLGYDLPVLYVEQLLLQERMIPASHIKQ